MSKAPTAAPPPPSLPTFVDFFLIVAGFGLSHLLLPLGYPRLSPTAADSQTLNGLVQSLPGLLRLTEGVLLLWPLLHGLQRLLGRRQGLTVGEWLWVFAWLGTALVLTLAGLRHWGLLPEFLGGIPRWVAFAWYVILVPSIALIALILALVGVLSRAPRPWTHGLGLALLIWPVIPLAGIMTLSRVDSWGG